jgi:hypothetical protein
MTFINKEKIDLVVAEAYLQNTEKVDLSTYSKIDTKGARHLASHVEEDFLLLGIREIDFDTARELKKFAGRISLPNLDNFDDQTAELIASFPYPVICNTRHGGKKIGKFLGTLNAEKTVPLIENASKTGIIHTSCYLSVTPEACEKITSVVNPTVFAQLQSLDSDCAKILASKKNLSFLNLNQISPDTARLLLAKDCTSLDLSSLQEVSVQLLQVLLSPNIQFLDLNGVTGLSDQFAHVFSTRNTPIFLSLNGVRSISVEQAQHLIQCGLPSPSTGTLSLKGIGEISPSVAEILSQYQGMHLSLNKDAICDTQTKVTLASNSKIRFQ